MMPTPRHTGPVVCKECGYGIFLIDMTSLGLQFRCMECGEEYTVMQLPAMVRGE